MLLIDLESNPYKQQFIGSMPEAVQPNLDPNNLYHYQSEQRFFSGIPSKQPSGDNNQDFTQQQHQSGQYEAQSSFVDADSSFSSLQGLLFTA
jgi:hypothetical protein